MPPRSTILREGMNTEAPSETTMTLDELGMLALLDGVLRNVSSRDQTNKHHKEEACSIKMICLSHLSQNINVVRNTYILWQLNSSLIKNMPSDIRELACFPFPFFFYEQIRAAHEKEANV